MKSLTPLNNQELFMFNHNRSFMKALWQTCQIAPIISPTSQLLGTNAKWRNDLCNKSFRIESSSVYNLILR